MSLHIPPCALALPLIAIPAMVIAMPLWAVALVVCGVLWVVLAPMDWIAKARGGGRSAARAKVGAWLHWLTHPTWPEKWTRK